jgi:hypothetical protein
MTLKRSSLYNLSFSFIISLNLRFSPLFKQIIWMALHIIQIYGIVGVTLISLHHFWYILAYGIHYSLVANPPISRGIIVPNSFVLPIHEVDVSHAPQLGLSPYGINSI